MSVGLSDRRTVGLLLLAACAGQSNRPTVRPAGILGPDRRVLISDFSEIQAVAASPWLVFAATPHGLLIYDRAARRFRAPVTRLDGYPGRRVRRAVADPSGNAVWLDLGSASGYARYDVDARVWSPGQLPSEQASLTVEVALASAPLVDAMRAAILTDARLRSHQFTAAAATPDRPEIFFGTNGLGLVRVDKQTGEWEVLTYGLLAPGVGAVATGREGLWAASNTRPGWTAGANRRGLTWIARDLSGTRSSEGAGAALGFSFLYSRRLIAVRDQLWLATEQGVLRIDPTTFRAQAFDLPEATSLAPASDGIWVGTTRGLYRITANAQVQAVAPNGLPVLSLLAMGDTLWVGTTAGLGQLVSGSEAVTTPPELADRPSLRVTIHALARLQDTVVMTTDRELLWRDPATRTWNTMALPLTLGVPTALAADPRGGLWIGGTHGLAQAEIISGFVHVHTVPFEIPAAVRDLTADRDFLWAATDSGLMRIQ